MSEGNPKRKTASIEQSPPWHTQSTEAIAKALEVDLKAGLSGSEAEKRQKLFGLNILTESKGRSALSIFIDQFKSLIVALLVVATAVAFALGEHIEAFAILVVIILNAAFGFFTEWKAEHALTALQQQIVPTARVIREGEEHQIPAADLVVGDIVLVAAGSRLPADGRVIESVQLQVAEAALTGESLAITKSVEPIVQAMAPIGDQRNMAFMGTTVTDGRGRILVSAIGMQTEMGRIGALIDAAGSRETPLERKLAQLGHALIGGVLVLCGIIVIAGWLRGNSLLFMLEIGISLAIAAVPEGLPAVATMTLAVGMQRMSRMGALVRRLPAVETLGSTTVICTDKTGTLTKDEMTVCVLHLGERRIDVSEEFKENGSSISAGDAQLALALRIGALCSDATLDRSGEGLRVLGDPTEGALLVVAAKAGINKEDLQQELPRIGELPFNSEAKRMVTVHRTAAGATIAFVKGGPSVVADASSEVFTPEGVQPMTAKHRQRIVEDSKELGGRALRVLALAYKDLSDGYREQDLAQDLVFVGLVGMIDPLREEATIAIERCQRAGIRIMMITGDQEATAAEIGRQLGLDHDTRGRPLRTAHGRDLAALSAEGWKSIAAEVSVFARVSPEHKLRIVEALQATGEVVAMTGDGVNDAPALKQADIGVAMGIKGTEVAKEAAAMVITDDNFATIVGAIEQGRVIYANILRFVHYLFSCNLAEILVVFIALMIGWPLPLGPLQILWLNMITDVLPAMALALEPSNPDVMKRPPRNPREPLMTPRFVWLITWQGFLLSGATLLAFQIGMHWYGTEGTGLRHAITLSFMTLALAQVFHAFNARSRIRSAFSARSFLNTWLWAAVCVCLLLQIAAVYTPFLQSILHTMSLSFADWMVVLACSFLPVGVIEIVKFMISRGHNASA